MSPIAELTLSAAVPSPLRWLSTWQLAPGLFMALLSAGAAYLHAVRYGTRSGPGWPRFRSATFLAGLVVTAIALQSGIDRYGEQLLSVHMVQHLLLVFVAAPLLVSGAPLALALRALPQPQRARLARALGSAPGRALSHPLTGWCALTAVVVGWHLSPLYELALRGATVHQLEHASYLIAGLLFWAPLLDVGPWPRRRSWPARLVYALAAMPAMSLVGAVLAAAPRIRYSAYATPARALGVSALIDQRHAAWIMWGADALLGALALAIAWRGMLAEERRAVARERFVARPLLLIIGLCCAALAVTGLAATPRAPARGSGPPAGAPRTPAPAQASGPPQVAGRTLFVEGCASCHGLDANGIARRGPSLIGVGAAAADFYLSTGRMPLDNPTDPPVRTRSIYSPSQIGALVAYIGSFGGPSIPPVDPAAGRVAAGFDAFQSSCSGCHQVTGRGGIVLGAVAPPLQQATAEQVVEAIRVGPYLMPRFGTAQIDRPTANSIARYVLSTRHPYDAGGWGIGHIGPIPEGMVAWLLALAALVIFARLIGERLDT